MRVLLWVCLVSSLQATSVSLVSIELQPATARLSRPNSSQQFIVSGKYSDGSTRDLTAQAKFTSTRPDGLLVPDHEGDYTVGAEVSGKRATAHVTVTNLSNPAPRSFAGEITPILTYAGCNQTACHGSPVGKNGFKLSLFGSDAAADYEAIRKRLSTAAPLESLVLRKPTMTVPHGGGLRFKKDSSEYSTMLGWIEAGAPFGDSSSPTLRRIEVAPGYRVLRQKGERQRLLVTAVYSDGATEDVTRKAVYSSNDDAVLKVDASGNVTAAGGTGDATILVRYGGGSAGAVLGATVLRRPADFPGAGDNLVDREVYAKLSDLNILPSGLSTDEEFIRRLYLDVLGILPEAGKVRQFLSSRDPDKRSWLVDEVLDRPEFADLQTLIWADRLRSDSRFHRKGGVRAYYQWLRAEFAANRPLDKFARALLTATGTNYSNGPANYWGNYDKISTPVEIAIQTGQVFMGVRIGCAQCHNHPFEKWTQTDFYSLAAVFAQVAEFHTKNTEEFDLHVDPNRALIHPVTKKAAVPRYLGGEVIDTEPGADRRVRFAEWLTSRDNPFFARAMANLIWRNLMGRGLVQPADDMRDTNPPTHPALLAALARTLADHNFDQKYVMRLILNSRTYQQSARADRTNEFDSKYYSRAYPKRLMAEVYMDAAAQVTGVPDSFKDWPEATRAVQLPDNRLNSYFLEVFQRNNRLVICDREENVTVLQGLHMVNGPELQTKLSAPDGRLSQWMSSGKSDSQIIEEMFLSALSRYPTPLEKDKVLTRLGEATAKREVFEDVLWALMNSKEFMFNH